MVVTSRCCAIRSCRSALTAATWRLVSSISGLRRSNETGWANGLPTWFARKVNVPVRANQVGNPFAQPVSLLRRKPEIEDTNRHVAAVSADRQDRIAQQREVTTIGPTADQEPSRRHRPSSGHERFAARLGDNAGCGPLENSVDDAPLVGRAS